MSKKNASPLPTINLKGDDFIHEVPADMKMEIIVHFKGQVKGQGFEPEVINPVKAFAKQGGKFKVINRNLPDTCYTFNLKEIKRVFLIPLEI